MAGVAGEAGELRALGRMNYPGVPETVPVTGATKSVAYAVPGGRSNSFDNRGRQ